MHEARPAPRGASRAAPGAVNPGARDGPGGGTAQRTTDGSSADGVLVVGTVPGDEARGPNEGAPLAEAIREACIRAALDAYEDAGIQGLCAEGRWELAVQAMRRVALP
jgi:hypothetical protein